MLGPVGHPDPQGVARGSFGRVTGTQEVVCEFLPVAEHCLEWFDDYSPRWNESPG